MNFETASYFVTHNEASATPLVLDSPHSNFVMPKEFNTIASVEDLRTSWDAFVNEIFMGGVELGATMLQANFPRMFLDLNRDYRDIDKKMIDGELPFELEPTVYSKRGMGLIREFALPDKPIYAHPISAEEINSRVMLPTY